MESFFNPFENRYPNRKKIICDKDKLSEKKINEDKKRNLVKDLSSLNNQNKKLSLFIKQKKLSEQETNFPEKFQNYGKIPNIIQNNLKDLNLETLTPIQKLFFGYLFNYGNKFYSYIKNHNLVGCAQTGSGKTLAYLIPSVSSLFNDTEGITQITKKEFNYGFISYPLILIILPTRELALQTYDESLKLLYKTYINTVVVYGGEKSHNQMHELNNGCDILIGTPGRLIDFLEKGFIDLSDIKYLVIDEADKLLDMGFEEDINHIIYDFQLKGDYNIFLMSATFPKKVLNMVDRIMNKDYCYITHGNFLGEKEEANENVKQRFYFVETKFGQNIFYKKLEALFRLLNVLDGKTLIFVNKKVDIKEIARRVDEYGYGIVCLNGDMEQESRKYSLEQFKSGNINLMVASDVASRGLDIPEVSYVVNFDMPNNIDIYIHRIGRTGRVGNKGSSLTLLTEEDRPLFRNIFEFLSKSKQKIPDFLNSRF